jgi:SAM-dependent methyltransferase
VIRRVLRTLPEPVKAPLRRARQLVLGLPYRGTGRWCPVCEQSSRRFEVFGIVPRPDAQCMQCGSLERHRLAWLHMQRRTDLFDGRPRKMLHVAPELALQRHFRRAVGRGYLTADLSRGRAMTVMDIENIQMPDASFDVIFCSHVLEHVDDDRRAMREFRRVLKPTGWAILLVPITADRTIEDATVTDPAERLRLFGQDDHVRRYGPDYVDRLREAGFTVATTRVADLATPQEAERMGLTPAAGEIYHCTKA